MRRWVSLISRVKYRHVIRPVLFKFKSETVHNWVNSIGRRTGPKGLLYKLIKLFFGKRFVEARRVVDGIEFLSPIGLAAGFDYNADLYQVMPAFGFGFTTIGTITNQSYEGNPYPQLGRLPKSKALLVNKGFKNSGMDSVLAKLDGRRFEIPTGISIGKSNVESINTREKATQDIVESFRKVIQSGINFSYLELNISCPNLLGDFSFYEEDNLEFLLENVQKLNINIPIYVKMPIELTDEKTLELLRVISNFKINGIIFGNLQKNRSDESIDQNEISKYAKGYPSGMPTRKRSTELIKLTKDNFQDRFTIIGSGGVFGYDDAEEKLDAGADLLQLITGLVYEGPQLVHEINYKLARNSR